MAVNNYLDPNLPYTLDDVAMRECIDRLRTERDLAITTAAPINQISWFSTTWDVVDNMPASVASRRNYLTPSQRMRRDPWWNLEDITKFYGEEEPQSNIRKTKDLSPDERRKIIW